MSDRVPNWADLDRKAEAPATPALTEKLQIACAHVFTGPAGKELMELLRKATIEQRVPDNASDAQLRTMEARRGLVFDLEKWRDAGVAALSKPKNPTA